MDLKTLKEKTAKAHLNNLDKLKTLYHYARSKGFTAIEARLLSHSSKATIDKITMEKLTS